MKKLFSKILSLAMVGTMAISNCATISANAVSFDNGIVLQYETIVVHTPEEFFEVFDDGPYYKHVYIANDLDFSSYDNFDSVDIDGFAGGSSIIGYDENTGEQVQRTFSNINFTTSGVFKDNSDSDTSQEMPDYNLGLISIGGSIENISFENVNVNIDSTYERDNGEVYPHFNIMSAQWYKDVSVYNLNINATGYFDVINVLGDSWTMCGENGVIIDGVTINGGDIHVFNTLPLCADSLKNVDVRNIEVNADNLEWFETLGWSVGENNYYGTAENITVSDITINNDILGFFGIGVKICSDFNNCAVQNVNINGSAEYVSGIGFV